ncbi:unnamed protein product [Arctia plantaginis]|uniref:Bifunctional lysine-specific demethylase and histidyl-hydroxylase n=1 Tax=Arctia plantaginis TaxID=874455 RepID=A0A8S1AIW2_ARCPL|nr:unnamed protein product [Arctia plantaginis]
MDSAMSAFAVYKNNKSTNQAKKQKKRNKSKGQSSIPKLNVDEIAKEIAQKVKKKQKKAKETKNIMKKKQHKKKKAKGKTVKNKTKSATVELKSLNHVQPEEIPVRVHVPASHMFPLESDTEVEDVYSESVIYNDTVEASEVSTLDSDCSIEFVPVQTDSVEEGLKVFKWMIAPYDLDEFLTKVWEKKPLHIVRKKPEYYKELISTPCIDNMLRTENVHFSKHVDITTYVDGKREDHNPDGRAFPHLVWDFYLNGCSVRLLNPQTFIPKVHLLNATLQEFFNTFVGANVYLTPPDSQGFAPHYDDIEAFILQVEGKKHWRIYKPLDENGVLPRYSSKNFDQSEIGDPLLEVTLQAGDMLYFPRGYIHQAVTIDGEHSLHVTVSMYQKHAWVDLLEKMLPAALEVAATENVELRQGLPFNIYDHFGVVHEDSNTPVRKQIKEVIIKLLDKIKDHFPIDDVVDQMHKDFLHSALPPVLNDTEKAVTVFGDSDVMVENGKVINRIEISLDTKIRLLRKNILRLVSEYHKYMIYYYVQNSLEHHGHEQQSFEIEGDLAAGVENLILSYPEYISVESLEVDEDSTKLQLAQVLYSKGLIMTEYPLENVDD